MDRKKTKAKQPERARTGVLTTLLIVGLLAALGFTLRDLRRQVADAQAENDRYAQQVEATQKENEALAKDIAEGLTPEKVEEIAREQLGLTTRDELIFYDISN